MRNEMSSSIGTGDLLLTVCFCAFHHSTSASRYNLCSMRVKRLLVSRCSQGIPGKRAHGCLSQQVACHGAFAPAARTTTFSKTDSSCVVISSGDVVLGDRDLIDAERRRVFLLRDAGIHTALMHDVQHRVFALCPLLALDQGRGDVTSHRFEVDSARGIQYDQADDLEMPSSVRKGV